MRLIYHAGVGDWVVVNTAGKIIAAMSWDDITASSRDEAEEWFRNWRLRENV